MLIAYYILFWKFICYFAICFTRKNSMCPHLEKVNTKGAPKKLDHLIQPTSNHIHSLSVSTLATQIHRFHSWSHHAQVKIAHVWVICLLTFIQFNPIFDTRIKSRHSCINLLKSGGYRMWRSSLILCYFKPAWLVFWGSSHYVYWSYTRANQ